MRGEGADEPVVAVKPGNAGGAKEPRKGDARRKDGCQKSEIRECRKTTYVLAKGRRGRSVLG